MTLAWPIDILPCRRISLNPAARNARASANGEGVGQIVATDAGFWMAELGDVFVNTPERRTRFRALQVQLEGGLVPILIPRRRADQPVVTATLAADAARRATALSLTINVGALQAGHDFSIGERLYRIRTIASQNSSAASITVWPPLREAAASGATCNFEAPVCRMRLANDTAMDLSLDGWRDGSPTVPFVEDMA